MSTAAAERLIFVETRAGFYRTQAASGIDAVMVDHKTAMLCFELSDLLRQGTNLFESIDSLDNDWRRLVLRGDLPFCEQFENRISRLYKDWLMVSEMVLGSFDRLESEFIASDFDVTQAHILRRYVKEIRAISIPDAEFFNHPALVELRDNALDAFQAGNTDAMELAD